MEKSLIKLPLDHIGIAVKDIEQSTENYLSVMGAQVIHDEEVPDQKVKVRFLDTGSPTRIELLEGTSLDSPVVKFIERRGEGMHHLAFKTEDIYHEFERLKTMGMHLLQDEPSQGANNKLIFFIHPKSMGGTLVEICQSR